MAGIGIKGIHLWQVSDGSLLKSFKQETGYGSSGVTFSPDGETLAAAGGLSQTIFLYRASDGVLLQTLEEPGSVYSVAFSPDRKILAGGLKSGNIDLWDIESGTLLRTLRGSKTSAAEIVFSPNGHTMASTASGAVDLWRVEDGQLLQAYPSETQYGMSIAGLAFSPDSQLLAVLAQIGKVRLLGVVP